MGDGLLDPDPTPTAEVPTARAWRTLGISSLGVCMFFLDATIVNVAFPAIQRAFPASDRAALSWIISAYSIGFASFLVAAGRYADLVGRRRIFLSGVALFGAGSAACALSPNVGVLVAARIIQAIGGAMLVPSALGLILPEFPPHKRATAVGLWSSVAAVAAAIGPSAGGALVEFAGWRWIFGVNLPIVVLAIAWGRRVLRESRDPKAAAPDLVGSTVLGAGMAFLALAIVQGSEWGWGDRRIVGAFAGFAILMPWFVSRSRRHASPVMDLSLFDNRMFAVAIIASLVFAISFFASMLNNMLFLTDVWKYSVVNAGLAVTPTPVVAAITAAAGGRLAEKRGFRVVVLPGAGLATAAHLWFALRVTASPSYLSEWFVGAVLLGAGIGLAFATLGGAVATALPPERFAIGGAVLSTARQLGAVLGVASVVAMLSDADRLLAFDRSWFLLAALSFASGLIATALPRPTRPGGALRATISD